MTRRFCTLSRPLAAMRQLPAVLGGPLRFGLHPGAEGLVVWGDHAPARRAAWLGRVFGLPLLRLEDGFMRSVGLGKAGSAPVSVVVDRQGLYFDARQASDLEGLINTGADAALCARAQALIETITRHDIDKYNLPRVPAPPGMAARYGAVLVDQVAGDRSIAGAGGSQADFDRMFADAMTAFGPQGFFIKAHPDVVAGFAQGHLDAHARRAGVLRIAQNLGPAALLARAEALWTLSSTLGFEALLRGVPVVTYGMPFYAGWGETEDRAHGPVSEAARKRRSHQPGVRALAACTLITYAQYADPETGAALAPEAALERIITARNARDAAGQAIGPAPLPQTPEGAPLPVPGQEVTFPGAPRPDFAAEALFLAQRLFERARAGAFIALWRAPPAVDEPVGTPVQGRVLVVEQPGLAPEQRQALLHAAQVENPGAEIVPVSRGQDIAAAGATRAYVWDDPLGWDLLLAGVPLTVLGTPPYAGWGLSDDRAAPLRARIDLETLVEARIFRFSRFTDPDTGAAVEPLEALREHLDLVRQARNRARIGAFAGVPGWRRPVLARFFSPAKGVGFYPTLQAAQAACPAGCGIALWAGQAADAAPGAALLRLEDGFIRSVGLGAAGQPPLSLVLDSQGIYYDPRQPSALETLLADARFDEALRARALALVARLLEAGVTKYNLSETTAPLALPPGRRIILVPGQVEDDASIRCGAPGITTLEHLAAVRARVPEAHILFKPHPDVSAGLRKGLSDTRAALAHANAVVADYPMHTLLAAVDEVHTLTSLTGFEALLRGKRVVCYGVPFYAGWGLTEDIQRDHPAFARRTRRLSLAELVAGALILYPLYADPRSGRIITAERAVALVERLRATPLRPHPLLHLRALWLGLRHRLGLRVG